MVAANRLDGTIRRASYQSPGIVFAIQIIGM
jgi:hypothetical protein